MARILIIDDDPLVRQTVRTMLEKAPHEVDEAADGGAGLERVRQFRPDLALTDILMPYQDGIEFIIQLRRIDPDVKVLAMSGGGRFEPGQLLLVAKALGADDYIAKPFTKHALLTKVSACLDAPAATAATA